MIIPKSFPKVAGIPDLPERSYKQEKASYIRMRKYASSLLRWTELHEMYLDYFSRRRWQAASYLLKSFNTLIFGQAYLIEDIKRKKR